jgi:hypothetical protein
MLFPTIIHSASSYTNRLAAWRGFQGVSGSSVQFTPSGCARWITLAQWQLQGALDYDQVELYAVMQSFLQRGPIELGEGESLSGRNYRFAAPLET